MSTQAKKLAKAVAGSSLARTSTLGEPLSTNRITCIELEDYVAVCSYTAGKIFILKKGDNPTFIGTVIQYFQLITKVGTNTLLSVYKNAPTTTTISATAISIVNDVITVGTPTIVATDAPNTGRTSNASSYAMGLTTIGTIAVLAYATQSTTFYGLSAIPILVNGVVVSIGTRLVIFAPTTITVEKAEYVGVDICAYSSTQAVLAYPVSGDGNWMNRILTLSGTTLTAGAETICSTSAITGGTMHIGNYLSSTNSSIGNSICIAGKCYFLSTNNTSGANMGTIICINPAVLGSFSMLQGSCNASVTPLGLLSFHNTTGFFLTLSDFVNNQVINIPQEILSTPYPFTGVMVANTAGIANPKSVGGILGYAGEYIFFCTISNTTPSVTCPTIELFAIKASFASNKVAIGDKEKTLVTGEAGKTKQIARLMFNNDNTFTDESYNRTLVKLTDSSGDVLTIDCTNSTTLDLSNSPIIVESGDKLGVKFLRGTGRVTVTAYGLEEIL